MTSRRFGESIVEEAAHAGLEGLGYTVKHGPDITPGGETLTQWKKQGISTRGGNSCKKCNSSISGQYAKNAFCFEQSIGPAHLISKRRWAMESWYLTEKPRDSYLNAKLAQS